MFQVGERVVYPQYGMGTISEITSKTVADRIMSFYRLEFAVKQMEILVPVQRAEENGLRRVMSQDETQALMEYITHNEEDAKPQQWHRWRKKTLEQIRSGAPLEMARIYCYLCGLEKRKGLSFTERKIMMQVEQMLASELAAAKQMSEAAALEIVQVNKKAPINVLEAAV